MARPRKIMKIMKSIPTDRTGFFVPTLERVFGSLQSKVAGTLFGLGRRRLQFQERAALPPRRGDHAIVAPDSTVNRRTTVRPNHAPDSIAESPPAMPK